MSIRANALRWLFSNFENVKGPIYSSKYYLQVPEESLPITNVWWQKIPLDAVNDTEAQYINVLCQAAPQEDAYHYLKIPVTYFKDHLDKFDIVDEKIHLYLSAEPDRLFIEDKGKGNLKFVQFLLV